MSLLTAMSCPAISFNLQTFRKTTFIGFFIAKSEHNSEFGQTYLLELCTIHDNSPNAFVDTAEDRAFKHALFSLETCSDVAVSGCVTSLTRLDSLLDSQVNKRFPI